MTSSFLPRFEDFTSTFLWFSRNSSRAPERKQLPKDFFAQLVKLEGQVQNKEFTSDTLDVLIQHYTKAVEHYDTKQDEVAAYFSYKIQDLLANKKSLNMLLGQSLGLKKCKTEEDEQIDERLDRNMWERRKRERDAKQIQKTIETLKTERQRLANFYCTVQNESDKLEQVTSLIVDDYDKATQSNDVNVKSGLNKQKERLRKRLEQKRSQSFENYAMNTSMASSIDGRSFIQEQIFTLRKDSLNESNIICESGNFLDIDDLEFEKEILKIGMADEVNEKVERLQIPSARRERRTKSRFMTSQILRAKEDVEEEARKLEEGEEKLSTNDSFANINVENLETENDEFNVEEAAAF
jgi:hypothetical protein